MFPDPTSRVDPTAEDFYRRDCNELHSERMVALVVILFPVGVLAWVAIGKTAWWLWKNVLLP